LQVCGGEMKVLGSERRHLPIDGRLLVA